jgi:hypothetical protein
MSSRLTDDPEHQRPGFTWPAEQIAAADSYAQAVNDGGIAAGLVFLVTRYGLGGTAGFLRECKYNRRDLKQAAATLKHVGGFDDLATMAELAAKDKSPPPPSWRQRQRTKMRERVKKLREKGWPSFR